MWRALCRLDRTLALALGLCERVELLVSPSDLNILNFAVSRTELPISTYRKILVPILKRRGSKIDASSLICLRLVLMNLFLITQETATSYPRAFLAELLHYLR